MFDPLSLRKVWKRLYICENEATIEFYHGSAICNKLRNRPTCRRSLTQRLVSWSSPVVSKVRIKTQGRVKGQRIGRAEAIQTGVINFQLYHCLSVSVCSIDTWEKSRLLTLKTNLATCCQKSSTLPVFFSYVGWGLGRQVFTELRFGVCSKKFSSVSGWSLSLNPWVFK